MSATNTQFSIAVHVLVGITNQGCHVTSEELAGSVNANPIFVKRVLAKLSKAGLLNTTVGKSGGCSLSKPAKSISLWDIYCAVEAPKAFSIHTYPVVRQCEVSSNIKTVMEDVLEDAQLALENKLRKTTVANILDKIKSR